MLLKKEIEILLHGGKSDIDILKHELNGAISLDNHTLDTHELLRRVAWSAKTMDLRDGWTVLEADFNSVCYGLQVPLNDDKGEMKKSFRRGPDVPGEYAVTEEPSQSFKRYAAMDVQFLLLMAERLEKIIEKLNAM